MSLQNRKHPFGEHVKSFKTIQSETRMLSKIQEIFGDKFDDDVIRLILEECDWKEADAVEKLCQLDADVVPTPVRSDPIGLDIIACDLLEQGDDDALPAQKHRREVSQEAVDSMQSHTDSRSEMTATGVEPRQFTSDMYMTYDYDKFDQAVDTECEPVWLFGSDFALSGRVQYAELGHQSDSDLQKDKQNLNSWTESKISPAKIESFQADSMFSEDPGLHFCQPTDLVHGLRMGRNEGPRFMESSIASSSCDISVSLNSESLATTRTQMNAGGFTPVPAFSPRQQAHSSPVSFGDCTQSSETETKTCSRTGSIKSGTTACSNSANELTDMALSVEAPEFKPRLPPTPLSDFSPQPGFSVTLRPPNQQKVFPLNECSRYSAASNQSDPPVARIFGLKSLPHPQNGTFSRFVGPNLYLPPRQCFRSALGKQDGSTGSLNYSAAAQSSVLRAYPPPVTSPSQSPRASDLSKKSPAVKTIERHIMNGCKLLVLMRGLPGSGKSHLARQIQGDGQVFSTDDFFYHRGSDVYDYIPGKLSDAHAWNQKRVQKALDGGVTPVIVDNTNVTMWEMFPYAAMAYSRGYTIEVLEPDTPWSFQPKRLAKCNSHGVPIDSIKRMKDRYETVDTASLMAHVEKKLQKNLCSRTAAQPNDCKKKNSSSPAQAPLKPTAVQHPPSKPTQRPWKGAKKKAKRSSQKELTGIRDHCVKLQEEGTGEEEIEAWLFMANLMDSERLDIKNYLKSCKNNNNGKVSHGNVISVKKDLGNKAFGKSSNGINSASNVAEKTQLNHEYGLPFGLNCASNIARMDLSETAQLNDGETARLNDGYGLPACNITERNSDSTDGTLPFKPSLDLFSQELPLPPGTRKQKNERNMNTASKTVDSAAVLAAPREQALWENPKPQRRERPPRVSKRSESDKAGVQGKTALIDHGDDAELKDRSKRDVSEDSSSTSGTERQTASDGSSRSDVMVESKVVVGEEHVALTGALSQEEGTGSARSAGSSMLETNPSEAVDIEVEDVQASEIADIKETGIDSVEVSEETVPSKQEPGEIEVPTPVDMTAEAGVPKTVVDMTGETEVPKPVDMTGETKVHTPVDITGETEVHKPVDMTGETEVPKPVDMTGETEVPKAVDMTGETKVHTPVDITGETEVHKPVDMTGETEVPKPVDMTGETEVPKAVDMTGETEVPKAVDVTGETEVPKAVDMTGEAKQPEPVDIKDQTETPDTFDIEGLSVETSKNNEGAGGEVKVSFTANVQKEKGGVERSVRLVDYSSSEEDECCEEDPSKSGVLTALHAVSAEKYTPESSSTDVPNSEHSRSSSLDKELACGVGAETSESSCPASPRRKVRRKKHRTPAIPFFDDSITVQLKSDSWKSFRPERQIPDHNAGVGGEVGEAQTSLATTTPNCPSISTQTEGRDFGAVSKGVAYPPQKAEDGYRFLVASEDYVCAANTSAAIPSSKSHSQKLKLDKSTTVDITCQPSADWLYSCFPGVAVAHLNEVLEVCHGDVGMAVELMFEWGISNPITPHDKHQLQKEMAKHRSQAESSSPRVPEAAAWESKNERMFSPPTLMDLCMNLVPQTNTDIQQQVINSSEQRLQRIESMESQRIRSISFEEIHSDVNTGIDLSDHCSLDLFTSSTSSERLHDVQWKSQPKVPLSESSKESSERSSVVDFPSVLAGEVRAEPQNEGRRPERVLGSYTSSSLPVASASDSALPDSEAQLVQGDLALPLPAGLVRNLEELFGTLPIPNKGAASLTVNLDHITAHHLYQCLAQSLSTQLVGSEDERTRQLREDEALAQWLQDEEEVDRTLEGIALATPQTAKFSPYSWRQHAPVSGSHFSVRSQQAPHHFRPGSKPVNLQDIMDEEMDKQRKHEKQAKLLEATGDHIAIATKLKREKLQQHFPGIDERFLEEIFQSNGYCLETTVSVIEGASGGKQPVSHKLEMSSTRGDTHSLTSTAGRAAQQWGFGDVCSSEETGEQYQHVDAWDSPDLDYQELRREASVHYYMRRDCFTKAQEALRRGMKDVASFYSQKAQNHFKMMKEANMRASEKMLESRQDKLDQEMTLDLHGLHVDEAVAALKRVIEDKEKEFQQKPVLNRQHLYVITGRGRHSQHGVARIRPAVTAYLDSADYRFVENKPGQLKVALHLPV